MLRADSVSPPWQLEAGAEVAGRALLTGGSESQRSSPAAVAAERWPHLQVQASGVTSFAMHFTDHGKQGAQLATP